MHFSLTLYILLTPRLINCNVFQNADNLMITRLNSFVKFVQLQQQSARSKRVRETGPHPDELGAGFADVAKKGPSPELALLRRPSPCCF